MSNLFKFIFCIFCANLCLAQNKYVFDYYTVYEDKTNSANEEPVLLYSFSNSGNNNYSLRFIVNNKKVNIISLFDFKKEVIYYYSPNSDFNSVSDLTTLLINDTILPLDGKECKETLPLQHFDIEYSIEKGNKNFTIKEYDSKEKKNHIATAYYYTKPSNITKNQLYNSWLGVCFLPFGDYQIECDGVITLCRKVVHNVNKNLANTERIRTLLEINKCSIIVNTTD